MLPLIALFIVSFLTTIPHEVAADVFVAGSTQFELTDYSFVKNGLTNGDSLLLEPFTVGGSKWAIKFYPLGFSSTEKEYISIMINCLEKSRDVKAMFDFRLLDRNTLAWSNDTQWSSRARTFYPSWNDVYDYGMPKFITRSTFEASNYLANDTLVIKTTLWVVQGNSTATLPMLNLSNLE